MKAIDVPDKIPVIWAENAAGADVATIPPTTGAPGRASWALGFPPLNMKPVDAGGIPPYGQDENGALKALSAWLRWAQMGGPIVYDPTFSAEVGGYPKGALIQGAALGNWWLSTVDDNVTDPDTGGAGWTRQGVTVTPLYVAGGTANALVVAMDPPTTAWTDGLTIGVVGSAVNTTSVTIDVGAGGAQLRRNDGAQLKAGDIQIGQNLLVQYYAASGRARLVSAVPSQLAGEGLKANGTGAVAVDIAGLPAGSVVIGSTMMFWNGSVLEKTTAGAVAGLAALSDQFLSEMQFWGTM